MANLTLDGFEHLLKENIHQKKVRGQIIRPKVNLVRYADDFIITGATRELLENEVKPQVKQFLRERGLQLSRHTLPDVVATSINDISNASISMVA